MYINNGKFRKLIWTKVVVGALLLVSSGLTLTACQNVKFGSESIKRQKENQSAKLKKNQSTPSKSKKSDQKPAPGQDNTVDDDPE